MSPPEIEQSDAMLAEAAKMDLVLMRHLHGLALATDDAPEVADLTRAYARASRCMRQNLALLAKQKADRAKAERETRPAHDPRDLRAEDLQDAVGRVISAAADGDHKRHADWAHRFDRELDDWYEAPDFLAEPLESQVRRACRKLDLPQHLAERWQDLPEPTFFPDPAPDDVEAANAAARALTTRYRGATPTLPTPPRPPWSNSG